MDNESAMPPPLGVRLLRRQGRGSGHERCRPKSNRPQAGVNGPVPHRAISTELVRLETPAVIYELFTEEIACRVQGRRFLWEFFD